MNGVITGSDIFDFTHSAVTNATEIFAGLLGDMGVRWVIANGSTRSFAALRSNGVRHIARNDPLIINGFAIGEWRHRPAEDRYVTDNPLKGRSNISNTGSTGRHVRSQSTPSRSISANTSCRL
jgi:hypothetical protein